MVSACCLPIHFWRGLCGSLNSSWWQSWLSLSSPLQGAGWLGHSSVTKQVALGQDGDAIPKDNAMSKQPLPDPHSGCVSPKGISLPQITDSHGEGTHLYPTAVWAALGSSALDAHLSLVMVSPWPANSCFKNPFSWQKGRRSAKGLQGPDSVVFWSLHCHWQEAE